MSRHNGGTPNERAERTPGKEPRADTDVGNELPRGKGIALVALSTL